VRDPAAADPPVTAVSPWRRSVVGGATAFAWVALAALVAGLLEWLATGRPFGVRLAWKLAGLYMGTFHGAGVRLRTGLPDASTGSDALVVVSPEVTLHVTFLLGTGFAAAMLWRAGRRAGRVVGPGWVRRIAWGASIAPVYALLVFVVALVVVLRFPSAGVTEVRLIASAALVGALLLALVAGGAGGGAAAAEVGPPPSPWGIRLVACLVGGWRMMIALLVLAFVGFLVVAGIRSDVSAAYVRGVARAGAAGATAAGHHVLLLPNQSFLIAAPTMGGCVAVEGAGSQPTTLCLRTLSVRPGFGATVLPELSSREVDLSAAWLLYLLVPVGATLWGGRAASAGSGSAAERSLLGAGAGVAFAVLVLIGEAVSTISVLRPPGEEVLRLGADIDTTAALALLWGCVGGGLGALLPDRRQDPPGELPSAGADVAVPPRPTSL
jgi:hypothetical protein